MYNHFWYDYYIIIYLQHIINLFISLGTFFCT